MGTNANFWSLVIFRSPSVSIAPAGDYNHRHADKRQDRATDRPGALIKHEARRGPMDNAEALTKPKQAHKQGC
jgi:hypothetical protein